MVFSFYSENENEVVCKLFPTCEKICIDKTKADNRIRWYKYKNCVDRATDENKLFVVRDIDSYIVAENNLQLQLCSLKEWAESYVFYNIIVILNSATL